MFARWPQLLVLVSVPLLLITKCCCTSAVDSYSLEVSFGSSHLVAGSALHLHAQLSNTNSGFFATDDLRWQLLVVGQSLDEFGFLTEPSNQEQSSAGHAYSLTWDNITFPLAGQYLLAFEGVGKATTSGAHPAEGASTLLGVAGPADKLMGHFNSHRTGVTDITVAGLPVSDQQQVVQLSSLLLSDGGSVLPHSIPAAQTYSISLYGPTHCVPGQPLDYTWTIKDAVTGEPISDLTPYTYSDMHVVIVSSDLDYIEHTAGGQVLHRKVGTSHESSSISNSLMDSSRSNEPAALAASSRTNSSSGSRRLLQQAHNTRELQASKNSRISGPSIQTQVLLPFQDTYLLVGVVRRGSEVIYMPFYVECSFHQSLVEAGNLTGPSHSWAHPLLRPVHGFLQLLLILAAISIPLMLC